MPIKVVCQCGQQFSAKEELAGKRTKCPKCGTLLTIPNPQAAAAAPAKKLTDLLDDMGMRAGIRRCPGCGAELAETAVLCVMCGYDTRIRRRLKTHVGSAVEIDEVDLGELPVHGVEALDKAERQIALDKLEQKRLIKGAPWWMIMLAFLGIVGFAVGMVSLPQEYAMHNSGILLISAGGFIVALYFLRVILTAFKESFVDGLVSIILPPVYMFRRWDRVAGLVILMAVGAIGIGLGFLLLWLAPMLQAGQEEAHRFEWSPREAVVMVCHDIRCV